MLTHIILTMNLSEQLPQNSVALAWQDLQNWALNYEQIKAQ